jgi:hypothetical protein
MLPRRAVLADLEAVQSISADAYTQAYLPVIGAIPKPAREDYRPRVERTRCGYWKRRATSSA